MAFENDCGVSTVLEKSRVATTTWHPLVRRLAALATRPSTTAPRRLWTPRIGFKLGDGKFEIRNSKFLGFCEWP